MILILVTILMNLRLFDYKNMSVSMWIEIQWRRFSVWLMRPGRIKQTFETRRLGRVGETGSPAHSTGGHAHSDGIAICRSSNA